MPTGIPSPYLDKPEKVAEVKKLIKKIRLLMNVINAQLDQLEKQIDKAEL